MSPLHLVKQKWLPLRALSIVYMRYQKSVTNPLGWSKIWTFSQNWAPHLFWDANGQYKVPRKFLWNLDVV